MRINPWEVHINDPEFYDTIYSTSAPFNKVPQHTSWTNAPSATFGTISHNLHRARRAAISPLFTKRQISNFAPEIQIRADNLCNRINSEYKSKGIVLDLDRAFGCLSTDVVTEYAFSRDYRYLDSENFTAPFVMTIRKMVNLMHTMCHFPLPFRITAFLPDSYVLKINPSIASIFAYRKASRKSLMGE